MANAGTVTVEFAAEFAKLTAGMRQVDDRIKSLESGFGKLGSVAKSALGFLSVGAIASFAKSALEAADAVGDMADKIGTTASQLSKLQYAAQQSDVEVESFNQALIKFNVNLSKADDGAGEAEKAFNKLGLSTSQLTGLDLEHQIGAIADAFSRLESPTDRVRIATQLFDKAGASLIPMLANGAEGIRKFMEEADRLGITLDDKAVKSIDIASKTLERFWSIAKSKTANLTGNAINRLGFSSGDEALDLEGKLDRLISKRKDLEGSAGRFAEIDRQSLDARISETQYELDLVRLKEFRLKTERQITDEAIRRQNLNDVQEFKPFGAAANISVPQKDSFDELMLKFRQEDAEKAAKILEDFNAQQAKNADDFFKNQSKIIEEHQQADLAIYQDAANRRLAIENSSRENSLLIEAEYQARLYDFKQRGMNAAMSLYTAFGGRYKKFAQALLAFEKAKEIASVTVETARLVVQSVKNNGGIPYGIPAGVAAAAFGAAQIAAIAATFIGGTSAPQLGGSAASPVFTNNTNTAIPNDQKSTATDQKVTQVVFNGPVYNTADFQKSIVDALKDVSDRDVVIFSGSSAQAQVIRSA